MKVCNRLKNFICGILLSHFNLVHVTLIAAGLVGHILPRQSPLYTQLRNDCSNGLQSCLRLTLEGGPCQFLLLDQRTYRISFESARKIAWRQTVDDANTAG